MSVFLSREQMFDRSLGGSSRENEVPHWAGNILWVLVTLICKIICRYHVDGRETLRKFKGVSGVVVVSNHTSFLDIPFLWCSVRPVQWLRLMARENLFDAAHGFGGQIMARVGAFPVKRNSADMSAIKRASRMLKNGEVVGIFPEGTRRGKGTQTPTLHAGAALVARMGKAPMLPACVRNADKVKVKGCKLIHFPTVYVEYGHPVYLESFDFLPRDERLDACIWYVMRECFALHQQKPADQVDMRALFPESRDFSDVFAQHPITAPDSAPVR